MSPKEKQATPKVAFVFLGPLTKVPPALAGSRARQRGEPESKNNERREKQAAAQQTFVFHKPLMNESPAKAGSRARMRGIREYKI